MTKQTSNKFSPEVRARAVRMVLDHEGEHPSRWVAIMSIAAKIGCTAQTLNEWVKKAEVDNGRRAGMPADFAAKLKALERENRELRQANESTQGVRLFCPGGARPPVQAMIAFIDDHREAHGVEPICKVLPIAPSTYHAHVARRADPAKRSARAKRDAALKPEIRRVFDDNFRVYGVRKVCRQLRRENHDVARCTVERLMRDMDLQGAIRGKPVRTTVSDKAAPCPLDHVNRQFRRQVRRALGLRLHLCGNLGWLRVRRLRHRRLCTAHRRLAGITDRAASFVLDALEQALHDRRPLHRGGLVHHSDRGSQYVSIKYTERLAEAGIEPSVGSVGDSYDNALAERINGLYKAEVIYRRGPWRSFEAVEFATLEWVDWFNNRRLLEPIGNIPPAEAEERYYAILEKPAMAASFKPNGLRQTRGGSYRLSIYNSDQQRAAAALPRQGGAVRKSQRGRPGFPAASVPAAVPRWRAILVATSFTHRNMVATTLQGNMVATTLQERTGSTANSPLRQILHRSLFVEPLGAPGRAALGAVASANTVSWPPSDV